jgi:hypothetical protein
MDDTLYIPGLEHGVISVATTVKKASRQYLQKIELTITEAVPPGKTLLQRMKRFDDLVEWPRIYTVHLDKEDIKSRSVHLALQTWGVGCSRLYLVVQKSRDVRN